MTTHREDARNNDVWYFKGSIVEKFSGRDETYSSTEWVQAIEEMGLLHGWTPRQHLSAGRLTLTGTAALWLCAEDPFTTWVDLKRALQAEFPDPTYECQDVQIEDEATYVKQDKTMMTEASEHEEVSCVQYRDEGGMQRENDGEIRREGSSGMMRQEGGEDVPESIAHSGDDCLDRGEQQQSTDDIKATDGATVTKEDMPMPKMEVVTEMTDESVTSDRRQDQMCQGDFVNKDIVCDLVERCVPEKVENIVRVEKMQRCTGDEGQLVKAEHLELQTMEDVDELSYCDDDCVLYRLLEAKSVNTVKKKTRVYDKRRKRSR